MNLNLFAGVAAALLLAGPFSAANAATAIYDITAADPTHLGPGSLGTVTVDEISANTLRITLDLATGYGLQNVGKRDDASPVLAFDLAGNPAVTFAILDPTVNPTAGGTKFTTSQGGTFLTQGWLTGFGYAVNIEHSTNPGYLYGVGGELLQFNVTSAGGLTLASLLPGDLLTPTNDGGPVRIGFGLDISGVGAGFATGPAGAVLRRGGGGGGVPEPATWGMMILGFGAAGSLIRRRRSATA